MTLVHRATGEVVARILTFVPLAFVTFQVSLLRLVLNSKSWTLIMVGFIVFFFLVGSGLVVDVPVTTRLLVSLGGYACIAWGFHTLRDDLNRILEEYRRSRVPGGRRSIDPPVNSTKEKL